MRDIQHIDEKEIDPGLQNYVRIIEGLHKEWNPHEGQKRIGKAVFQENKKKIFIQCGRKFGKTEIVIYILWRWAQQFPGSSCYYISPFFKQSKEIIWANRRIQTFGPADWLLPGSAGTNKSELRLNFKNGSFIKLDGSDNFEAYRGVEPHLMVYEEMKDFRPEFHIAMSPNLAVYKAPLVVIGTPPDRECQYLQIAEEVKKDDEGLFWKATSYDNPHIDKEWLDKERAILMARGEWDVWEREYMANYVPGGISKIFPMLERTRHVVKHEEIMATVMRDYKKMEFYIACDPAASSTFAALFCAVNPYTKTWYMIDEIYESDQNKLTVSQMGNEIIRKRQDTCQHTEWTGIYDEANTWFHNEMMDRFGEYFQPTRKSLNKKEHGLSIVKDTLLQDKIVMSEKCGKLFWEMDNYFKDKNGKIPKENDHLIDCLRYAYSAAYYELNPVAEPKLEKHDEDFRGARISDDFPGLDDMGHHEESEDEISWEIPNWD